MKHLTHLINYEYVSLWQKKKELSIFFVFNIIPNVHIIDIYKTYVYLSEEKNI